MAGLPQTNPESLLGLLGGPATHLLLTSGDRQRQVCSSGSQQAEAATSLDQKRLREKGGSETDEGMRQNKTKTDEAQKRRGLV